MAKAAVELVQILVPQILAARICLARLLPRILAAEAQTEHR